VSAVVTVVRVSDNDKEGQDGGETLIERMMVGDEKRAIELILGRSQYVLLVGVL